MDPKILVDEAKSLITAASHSNDEHRYHQLMVWAREVIAPLVDANHPEALWITCSLPDRDHEKATDEEFDRRYWEAVRKAAEAGSVSATFRLACELDEDPTREESARLFAEAANAGHAYASWCHGLNLLSGTGVEKDEELGLAYIRESAKRKFEGAIKFVADAYAAGTYGYPQDRAESARWWKMLNDKDLITY